MAAGRTTAPQTAAQAHAAQARKLADRKRTRKARGEIHAAMDKARTMKRSRKKGTADMDTNMLALGYRRVSCDRVRTGRIIQGRDEFRGVDVLDKFERVGS